MTTIYETGVNKVLAYPLIFFVMLLQLSPGHARSGEGGAEAGEFLDFAMTSRASGMGRAHVAVADDAGAISINPSGLSQLKKKDFVTLYSFLIESTRYGFASYAQPVPYFGALGISVVTLQSGDFVRRNANGEEQGRFDSATSAVLLSNSFRLRPKFAVGTTVKYVRDQLAGFSDNGFGADLGFLYQVNRRFQTGLSFQNALAPALKLKDREERYSRTFQAGVSWLVFKNGTLAVDGFKKEKGDLSARLGTEWRFQELLSLRAGWNENELTTGLGITLGGGRLDYAFGYLTNSDSDLDQAGDGQHRVGFHLSFGAPFKERGDSLVWKSKGQAYLRELQDAMESSSDANSPGLSASIEGARECLRQEAYDKPSDFYAVQAYVYYFQGNYEASMNSFERALRADPENSLVRLHSERARLQFARGGKTEWIAYQRKEVRKSYRRGDWENTVRYGNEILNVAADEDVQWYVTRARQKWLASEIHKSQKQWNNGRYQQAYYHLRRAYELDPGNEEILQRIRDIEESIGSANPNEPSVVNY